ncbi:hypothetical protein GQR58_025207 [Nymphon striatum]|nr:hypothetical protein GQR58_025207 [Nymphon striatum]
MSPSTKCTKHFNLTRPQKNLGAGAHKKEVKFSLNARKTLHTTHISKSIGNFCRQQRRMHSSTKLQSALLSAEIIPIDLEICVLCKVFFASNENFTSFLCARAPKFFEDALGRVRLKCLVHFVDGVILRCCRQKLFKSTKKCVL